MKQSSFLKINARDLIKGAIMAFLTSGITVLIQILNLGAIPSGAQWKMTAISGLVGILAYLLKNWLTNSNDEFMKVEKSANG